MIATYWFSDLANHLWQSSFFLVIVALLAVALRKNSARVRYRLWLIASIKFLVPFSALITISSFLHLTLGTSPIAGQPEWSIVINQLSQPFGSPTQPVSTSAESTSPTVASAGRVLLFVAWLSGGAAVLAMWCIRWRRIRATMRAAVMLESGREPEALKRCLRRHGLEGPAGSKKAARRCSEENRTVGPTLIEAVRIRLASSPTVVEPCVFGIFRPVLLVPEGIADRLDDAQLEAVFAHELTHVWRHDNLTATLHMLVQSIFWFHPLVWWLGARLIEERERACDEAVVQLGNEPQAYAEGILRVCEIYIESTLACMAGVTGSNLTRRIEAIMMNRITQRLNFGRKFLLATAGIITIAGPILIGLVRAPQSRGAQSQDGPRPSFEVASIKPNNSGDGRIAVMAQPGGRFVATNVPLKLLMRNAYRVQDFQISGGPSWINSDRFDVEAKADGAVNGEQVALMLQSLLEERFKLNIHRETKELPVYALVVGKDGQKLQQTQSDTTAPAALPPSGPPGERGAGPRRGFMIGRGQLEATAADISQLTTVLSQQVGRTVIDKTGLKGLFDFKLKWTPEPGQPNPFGLPAGPGGPDIGPPIDPNGPSIFTAVQEQLGLKLESQRGPVEIIVIDSVDKPSEN
jgi:bla regulator protein BlaR1